LLDAVALQTKVTLEEVKLDPGDGLDITAAAAAGVGVGVGVPPGVGVGVGVGLLPVPSYPITSITRRSTELRSFLTPELLKALKVSFVPLAQS
jgi:hypothetical protein